MVARREGGKRKDENGVILETILAKKITEI